MRNLITVFALSLLFAAAAQAKESALIVDYDKLQDKITLKAEKTLLSEILASIAIQSGLEVLFDNRADQTITLNYEKRPLRDALKNLLADSNYAFRYAKGNNDEMLLVGVKVLPQGDSSGGGNALPLLYPAGEAFMNAKYNHDLSAEEQERKNAYNQRWQSRLAEMPDEVREMVEKKAQERLEAMDKRQAEREARAKEQQAKNEERRDKREAKRNAMLETLTPEERAQYEQRRKNARDMAINIKSQQ